MGSGGELFLSASQWRCAPVDVLCVSQDPDSIISSQVTAVSVHMYPLNLVCLWGRCGPKLVFFPRESGGRMIEGLDFPFVGISEQSGVWWVLFSWGLGTQDLICEVEGRVPLPPAPVVFP